MDSKDDSYSGLLARLRAIRFDSLSFDTTSTNTEIDELRFKLKDSEDLSYSNIDKILDILENLNERISILEKSKK